MVKQVQNHPDYGVTDSGEVVSLKGKEFRLLKPDLSNGYPRITLDGERYYLADLVADSFLGPAANPNLKIFYIDGDKTNCDVSNIIRLSMSDIQKYSQYSIERRIQIFGQNDD